MLSLRGRTWVVDVSLEMGYSTHNGPLYFDQLWFSVMAFVCFGEKLPWGGLKATLLWGFVLFTLTWGYIFFTLIWGCVLFHLSEDLFYLLFYRWSQTSRPRLTYNLFSGGLCFREQVYDHHSGAHGHGAHADSSHAETASMRQREN